MQGLNRICLRTLGVRDQTHYYGPEKRCQIKRKSGIGLENWGTAEGCVGGEQKGGLLSHAGEQLWGTNSKKKAPGGKGGGAKVKKSQLALGKGNQAVVAANWGKKRLTFLWGGSPKDFDPNIVNPKGVRIIGSRHRGKRGSDTEGFATRNCPRERRRVRRRGGERKKGNPPGYTPNWGYVLKEEGGKGEFDKGTMTFLHRC